MSRHAAFRPLPLVLALGLGILPGARPAAAADPGPAAGREAVAGIYEALAKVELDPGRSVKVTSLQVGLDVMDITLTQGRLFFARPWKEGVSPTGAIFIGEGRARFTPVNQIEKHEFKKAYEDKESFDETFRHAFLRFNDDFYDAVKDRLEPDKAPEDLIRLFHERQKALDDLLFNAEFAMFGPDEGDKLFFATLKAFMDRFRHQNATTGDLIQVVNEMTKKDYSGFFKQWFRETGLPEVTFSYAIRPTEDGKFVVHMKAVQADKENVKQMYLPVSLYFGSTRKIVNMPIGQAESTFQVKLPASPDRVVANDPDGALVKVVTERSS